VKALIGCLRDERRIEALLALIILASIVQVGVFVWQNNYLPPPFFYEPEDAYADWFNTAYWARSTGAYDVWTTLYPPLTFVFLRPLGFDECYPQFRAFDNVVALGAAYSARDCDWPGIVCIWGFFALNAVLTYKVLKKIDPRTALLRTCCVGIGWPMLDAVERGNLFLVAYTCFLLAVSPVLRSARLRALFAGLAINFKIYLIAAFAPIVLKRQWTRVEMILISTIALYLASFSIFGYGNPIEIVTNLTRWSDDVASQLLDLWPATSYRPLIAFVESDKFPLTLYLDSETRQWAALFVTALLKSCQLLILVSAVSVYWRPEAVPAWRLINLGLLLAIVTTETGGYTPGYVLLLLMMEPWRGWLRKSAIVIGYLLAIPQDIPLANVAPVVRDTYIGHSTTIVSYSITLAPLVRPGLIIIVAMLLSALTLHEVWQAVRRDGLGARPLRHSSPGAA
jgi:hypothetical protein